METIGTITAIALLLGMASLCGMIVGGISMMIRDKRGLFRIAILMFLCSMLIALIGVTLVLICGGETIPLPDWLTRTPATM